MERSLPILVAFAVLTGCTKENALVGPVTPAVYAGRIVVNEVVSSGSVNTNEFGEHADWIELYNPGPAISLQAGAWFLTDEADTDPHKFELPELELPAQGFLLVWCDGEDVVGDEVHASFALSGKDGFVHLVHASNGTDTTIDEAPIHDGVSGDASMGRSPDGTANWTRLSPQTPGASNELAAEP